MNPVDNRTAGTSGTFKLLSTIALVLLIVGGINWALVGLLNFDLVAALFGPMSALSRIVYVVVGIAALYGLYILTRLNRRP
jgi:uncharacterized membrane protein YuzA (DUF378 family)|nr:DUF378 domain-containing protein [uncultured Caldimonas sp.]